MRSGKAALLVGAAAVVGVGALAVYSFNVSAGLSGVGNVITSIFNAQSVAGQILTYGVACVAGGAVGFRAGLLLGAKSGEGKELAGLIDVGVGAIVGTVAGVIAGASLSHLYLQATMPAPQPAAKVSVLQMDHVPGHPVMDRKTGQELQLSFT